MAAMGKKIGIGCGIGCLVVLIIGGGIIGAGVWGVKNVVDEAEGMDVAFDELRLEYGEPHEYVPPADGRLDGERIEAFLAIREQLAREGAEIDKVIRTLDDAEGGDGGPIAKVRAGLKLVPGIVRYIGSVSSAMATHGMGPGEYAHLYCLGYYVALDRNPGAGPDFRLQGGDHDEGGVHVDASVGDEDPREARETHLRETMNSLARKQLTNQRDAAVAAGLDAGWIAQLDAEIDALRIDWERLPWQDGLPTPTATSLAPYRERFEASWQPYLNAIEAAAVIEQK